MAALDACMVLTGDGGYARDIVGWFSTKNSGAGGWVGSNEVGKPGCENPKRFVEGSRGKHTNKSPLGDGAISPCHVARLKRATA